LVVRNLLATEEVSEILQTFMDIHAGPPISGVLRTGRRRGSGGRHFETVSAHSSAPINFSATALKYMLHPRLFPILKALLGEAPLASQSMFYYKPPGARGQALHQDNYYLKVEPGTCIAAWTAIDDCDNANGGMQIVPKSNELDILCPERADPKLSFYPGDRSRSERIEGDRRGYEGRGHVFFNGNVIHGSGPNRTTDRFRRSFTCHYVGESTERLGSYFSRLYDFEGSWEQYSINAETGPCGDEFAGFYGH